MSSREHEDALTSLLKRLASSSTPTLILTRTEISTIANSLLPSSPRSAQSLAILCLSKYCQVISGSESAPGSAVEDIYATFKSYVQSTFDPASGSRPATATITEIDDSTPENDNVAQHAESEPESCLPLAYLLSNLFPLAPESTVKLLTTPLSDVGDPLSVILEIAELPSPVQPALAELLTNAAGTKKGREMVRARAMDWLKGALEYAPGDADHSAELGVLCAVALSKLSREEATQPQGGTGEQASDPAQEVGPEDEVLCRKLMAHIESTTSSSPSSSLISTVEGLAILSLRPKNKVVLASPRFLKRLLALSPVQAAKPGSLPVTPRGSMDLSPQSTDSVDTGLCYGLTTLLVNLTSPKPVLSAEDQQIAKLRAMAIGANKGKLKDDGDEGDDDSADSEEEVRQRTKAVIRAGGVTALTGLGRADSLLVKEGLGRLCRNLVEDQSDRLPFVRDGGFKVLSAVSRDLLTAATTKPKTTPTANAPALAQRDIDLLPAFQALAKMIITTPPHLLFPPPHQTTSRNALTPLYHLLVHPSSTSLQRFESLMALTNLASIDPSIAARIVLDTVSPLKTESAWRGSGREDGIRLIVRIEELLLDENELVRRAACQLTCNLVSSQTGYEYFSGEHVSRESGGTSTPPKTDARVKSRLSVLLVLSGSDDLATRLAVGGGLAIITESPKACAALLAPDTTKPSPSTATAGTATIEPVDDGSRRRTVWTRVLDLLSPDEEEIDEHGDTIPVISSTPLVPNPDLVHRGVIILLNLVAYVLSRQGAEREDGVKGIRDAGVTDTLMGVLRMKVGEEVLQPTVECLKMLKKAQV